jgi:hypothetical protein
MKGYKMAIIGSVKYALMLIKLNLKVLLLFSAKTKNAKKATKI